MQLNVIGSGSSGNGYILQNDDEALVVECGMPLKDVVKVLKNNLNKIVGCLMTHSHGDHARYVKYYARPFNVYATKGTLEEKGLDDDGFHYHAIEKYKTFAIGNFVVKAFDTVHDTKEPCGFIISHSEIGNMLFLTDTHHVKFKFNFPLDYILIECNHTDALVDKSVEEGIIPKKVGIRAKATHMSLKRCINCLKENDLHATKAIVLIHMSAHNGNAESFSSEVAKATGKPVYVAKSGLNIEMFK